MSNEQYTRVALDENDADNSPSGENTHEKKYNLKNSLGIPAIVLGIFAVGFVAGGTWAGVSKTRTRFRTNANGLLNPQSFIPEIPTKEVLFTFPTDFDNGGELGNRLWNELMPLGSGFLRVPHPRKYDMPRSKTIPDDPEDAEIYSVSMTHQLHCLGVIRHVIMEYEKGSKSRFTEGRHEYHCLDYKIVRQAVLCAGDTTLDHAAVTIQADGSEHRLGFTGDNSTHQCRDWEAIRTFLIEHRSGDKTGIL